MVSRSRYHVEALARGLLILSLFTPEEPWLSLSDIARRAGLTTATALRFVSTLRSLGFLEQSPETRKYRPSLATLKLGYSVLAGADLRALALPVLQRLSVTTGETVNMAVLAGVEIVYIERLKTTELITANVQVGSLLPAHCTSMGKVLLAALPPEELDRLLPQIDLTPRGPKAITSVERLRAELERVRAVGYAIQDEELVAGLRSAAAPITDRDGRVIAAINIAVPAARVSVDRLRGVLLPAVIQAATEISAFLQYRSESLTLPATQPPAPATHTARLANAHHAVGQRRGTRNRSPVANGAGEGI